MKKRVKTMATSPVRVYERIMRKLLLNNLSLVFCLFLATPVFASLRPVFVVLAPDTDLNQIARDIQFSGGRVRQRVPPRVFVADLPPALNLSLRPGVQTVYTSAIPLDQLTPLGTLAVAAGTHWNRQQLEGTKKAGGSGFGAMRTLVAQRSLPRPTNLQLRSVGDSVEVTWIPVAAALFYEVEASASSDFSDPIRTRSNRPGIRIPSMGNSTSVRVRAVDTTGADKENENVRGTWSDTSTALTSLSLGNGASIPVLSSPLDGSQTEGFTLILEWMADSPSTDYRMQASRNAAFSDMIFDEVVAGGEYACPGPALREGDRLYWRVRRWDAVGSNWSAVRNVKIGAPRHHEVDSFVNPEAPQ